MRRIEEEIVVEGGRVIAIEGRIPQLAIAYGGRESERETHKQRGGGEALTAN